MWPVGKLATRTGTGCSLLACLVASSCGGGGSGSSDAPSEPGFQGLANDVLVVNFPFAHAAYSASSVTVSGSLNHDDFADISVTAIAGDARIPAFVDAHGNFLAPDVPLRAQGTVSPLQVTASHPRRGNAQRSFLLSQDPDLASLVDIEMDPRSDRVNGNSGTVYGIDLSTGATRSITNRSFARTPYGNFFRDIEILDRTAYLVDSSGRAIIRLNLTSGRQEILSNPATFQGERVGSGPLLLYPRALAMDVANDRLIVADEFADALVSVDTQTGDRTLLTDAGNRRLIFGTGNTTGTIYTAPTAVAADPAQGVLYYGDFTVDALFEVDLAGGTPTIISDEKRGTGPLFGNIIDIELDSSSKTAYILDSLLDAVLTVDIDTGDRRIVSDATIGVGGHFRNPVGLQLDLENDRAFVSDANSRSIHEINLLSGDRTVVSSWQIGGGARVRWLGDIAYDSLNERFVAIDTGRRSLMSIDLATGEAEIISGDASLLLGIEDPDGRLQLLDIPRHVGGGAVFAQPGRIELSADEGVAYVLDAGYDGVLAVELQKGDRQLISK